MNIMKKQILSLGLIILVCSSIMFTGCVTKQTPVVTPKTTEDRARDIVTLLIDKNYTGVYSYFNTSITTQISAVQFQNIWEQNVQKNYGNLTRIDGNRTANESGYQVVYETCNFSKPTELDVKIVFNSQDKVISLTVVPTTVPYTPPSYVNQQNFTEESVTVGSGTWLLPGNLTIPNGPGPFPAVVLVQGSGANDQDETIGPNKPFKDIAYGLSSQGIAVLRYVKRTREYPQQTLAMLNNFTVQDEVIDDVIAAIDLLNASPLVDHARMFVLGHSLGGYLAPRIASEDHRIAGVIMFAAPTRHLEDLILEQTRYLANLSGMNQTAEIEAVERGVEKIKTLNFTGNETVFGAGKAYWQDLSTYDPVAVAQTLRIPMLILQGLRDYQVTLTDFERWNQTFSGNPLVTLKTYPSLNHLFIPGTGTPSNAEYQIPGHVSAQVVSDTVRWVKTH